MSFDKVEVRVFSGPDQVQVGSNTEPDLIVMNIGPKGDTGATGSTGPAGPNSVTSATTSDGTANLSLGDLEVVGGEIYTDGEYSHIYTQGDGAEIFTIGDQAQIYTQGASANISTSGENATIYTAGINGSIFTTGANAGISTTGANASITTEGTNATIETLGSAAHIVTAHASAAVKSTNFAAVESGGASLVDGSMQPCLTWSAGGRNLTIPSGTATTFNTTSYTFGTGAASAFVTALGTFNSSTATALQNSRNIFGIAFNGTANVAGDATNTGHFASIPTGGQAGHFVTLNGTAPTVIAGRSAWWSDGSGNPSFRNGTGTAVTLVKSSDLGANVANFLATPTSANLASALTDENGTGGGFVRAEGATLTSPTLVGTPVFNATDYTYGAGAAAAHRTALGVTSTQLQTESLFSLLTLQESDSGSYTANSGTAQATQDGDLISLSATTANQRPNVYRFRNWSRNPGNSGSANPVMPLKLASAGVIVHSGTTANGGNFRCGIGMINGASAVAADANATAGRGFGWRIAWNSSTSKLEFNLWAHNGTTYSEGAGIDTGLGASNIDGFFNVIVCLAADGTVTANTWFGTNTALSTPSTTPTVTLAGGPTSGAFANQGIPLWIAAAHSTNAPSGANTIIARVINRKLQVG